MFAVIRANGFQYLVSKGDTIVIPAYCAAKGEAVEFDQVLMVKDNGNTIFGKPYVKGARVKGIVRETGKLSKVTIFKLRRRKKYRRKQGHRQDYSKVEITNIQKGKQE